MVLFGEAHDSGVCPQRARCTGRLVGEPCGEVQDKRDDDADDATCPFKHATHSWSSQASSVYLHPPSYAGRDDLISWLGLVAILAMVGYAVFFS